MKALEEMAQDEDADVLTSDRRIRAPIKGAGGMSYLAFLAIGEGGMARVLLARARGPGGFEKLVVLKTIRKDALNNPKVRKLFVDEARLCAQLNHPNLVQVYDVDLDAESPRLVMEYLEGKTLNDVLHAGSLPRIMLLTVCSEVLSGLHYAHELRGFDGELMNVVHRDVSPHNVFVTYDGSAKVLDFGIAKMAGAVSDTATEAVKGKLSYMAPEQLMGSDVDRRADVFAVGVMLWEIAVGQRLWDGVSEPEMMHRLATLDIPKIPLDSDVDAPLAAIIHKATAADVDARYASAQELQDDLDEYLATQGRRPALRQIGETLAIAFEEERERTASRIRLALRERETTPPPADETDPFSKERSRRGWLVAGAIACLGVFLWIVFATDWGRSRGASGRDMEPETIELNSEQDGEAARSMNSERHGLETENGEPTERALGSEGRDNEVPSPNEGDDGPPHVEEDPEPDEEPDAAAASTKKKSPVRPIRRTWRAPKTVAPVAAPPPVAAPVPEPAPAGPSCNPPFYYKDGIKTYRPECL